MQNRSYTHIRLANLLVFMSIGFSLPISKGFADSRLPIPFRELQNPIIYNTKGIKVFWSASEVQEAIVKVRNMDFYKKNSHLTAYLRVYQKMTAKRDFERTVPKGRLIPEDTFNERLNDALSDLMTKNYLRQMVAFARHYPKIEDLIIDAEFNEALYEQISPLFLLMHEAYTWKQNPSIVALNTTFYYLSVNITYAISALPHYELLWKDRPEKNLYRRINRISKYVKDFRKFNSFLTDNTSTVTKVLAESGNVLGNLINAPIISPFLPLAYVPIYIIRENAFWRGTHLAKTISFDIKHPYLKQMNWWPTKNFQPDFESCNVF